MKYIIFLVVIFFTASCGRYGPDIPCLPLQLSSHVIAFYPFDSLSLNDKSGYNQPLINVGNAIGTIDRQGNKDCAYRFNGSPTQFLTRDGYFLNGIQTQPFSISFWYQPIDGSNEKQILISRGEEKILPCKRLPIEEWNVALYDCERASFLINGKAKHEDLPSLWQDSTIINKCEAEKSLYNNKWHHIVVTFSKDSLNIYRNGIKCKRKTFTSGCPPIVVDQGNIYVGKYLFGDLDDIIFFNKVLSQAEVNVLYNLDSCCL